MFKWIIRSRWAAQPLPISVVMNYDDTFTSCLEEILSSINNKQRINISVGKHSAYIVLTNSRNNIDTSIIYKSSKTPLRSKAVINDHVLLNSPLHKSHAARGPSMPPCHVGEKHKPKWCKLLGVIR